MVFPKSKRPGETKAEYESAWWDFQKKTFQQYVSREFPEDEAEGTHVAQTAKPKTTAIQLSTSEMSSPADFTASKTPPSRYKKRSGVTDGAGESYECKMLTLVFLRMLAAGYEFQLASNMEAAGAFDDIVVKYRKRSCDPWVFTCMQLKHKQGKSKHIPKTEFLKLSEDFSLVKYCASFALVKSSASNDIQSSDEQFTYFILYTNANISPDLAHEVEPKELFSTGGEVVSFKPGGEVYRELCEWVEFKETLTELNVQVESLSSEGLVNKIKATMEGVRYINKAVTSWRENLQKTPTLAKLKELLKKLEPVSDKDTYSSFLAELQVYSGQACEWELDAKIKEELAQIWWNSNDLEAKEMFNEVLRGVQSWWKSDNTYLTEDSPLWLGVIKSQAEFLSKDTIDGLTRTKVEFEERSLQDLCDKINGKGSAGGIFNLQVDKRTSASSLRVQQALARLGARDLNVLHVNVKAFLAREADVLSAWATRWCPVLVVECDTKLCLKDAERISKKISNVVDRQNGRKLLILIAPEKHELNVQLYHSKSYTSFHDNGNWLDLTETTKKYIISKNVVMNRVPTQATLLDLVGEDKGFFNKVNLEVISQFIRDDFCFGKDLDKEGEYFVTRRLKDSADSKSFVVNSVRDVPGKVVLVVAEPGMGKTTLFTHLARSAKIEDPSAWVVHIKLNDCVQHLKQVDVKHFNEVALTDFLEQAAVSSDTCFERLLFRSLKNKLVVFVDGVDEVCPHYETQVFALLSSLKDMEFSKLCVASRPVFRNYLENILIVRMHHLVAFSKADQTEFFNKVREQQYPSASPEECSNATQQLLTWLTESLGKDNPILGVPLMNAMIAQTFQEGVFLEISEKGESLRSERLGLISLYRHFVEKKFDLYCVEKKKTPNRELAANLDDEKKLKEQMHHSHRLAALRVLFSPEEISSLQFDGKERFDEDLTTYLKEVSDGREKMGIIDNVVDGVPHFVHRSFAEYFVALMLARCFKENRKILERVAFNSAYGLMIKMFHWSLAENHPLHVAVLKRDVKEMKSFLTSETPADVNEEDAGGLTPLHLAVILSGSDPHPDDICIVKLLIQEHKANLNVVDKVLGWVPLQYAEMSKAWEALQIILKSEEHDMKHLEGWREPDPSLMLDGARNASLLVFRYLVEKRGGNLDCRGLKGETVIHVAAIRADVQVLEYLLNKNLSLQMKDNRGDTALHYVSRRGIEQVVRLLLRHGADVNAMNDMGDTVLHLATLGDNVALATLLLEEGASVDCLDVEGNSPMHIALWRGSVQVITLLLRHCADVNALNRDGETMLHHAAWSDNLTLAILLLKKGASSESRDVEGNTALHIAIRQGSKQVGAVLLRHGADITAVNNNGETMLHLASWRNNLAMATLLLEKGASVECRDLEGNTPMHVNAQWGIEHVAALLLRHGADVNAVNNAGLTPLDLATHGERWSVVTLLKAAGARVT